MAKIHKKYRLGIDLGTNSIGTALIELDEMDQPCGILHMGVRIFSDGRDPKSKASLAVGRRVARQARKRRDRYLRRRDGLLKLLEAQGLFPSEETVRKELQLLNPIELRFKGLSEKLTPYELGRALFHINQRRGFKSNRKTDSKASDAGVINSAVKRLDDTLRGCGARTLGEYLHIRKSQGQTTRVRLVNLGKESHYEFYPTRAAVEHEINTLWEAQKHYYPELLTDDKLSLLRSHVLFQRPLKAQEPGPCSMEPAEKRCAVAHPLYQEFRLLQTVNELRISTPGCAVRALSKSERDLIVGHMWEHKKETLAKLRRILQLDRDSRFTLEDDKRKDLPGHQTNAILAEHSRFGKKWGQLPLDQQWHWVQRLLNEENTETLIAEIQSDFGFGVEKAEEIAMCVLPEGYGMLSELALSKIVPQLRAQVITYSEAAANVGYDHSLQKDCWGLAKLPYYGQILERHLAGAIAGDGLSDEQRFGKIANPTVHIGLNQLRRVVNCLIRHYGHPYQIVLELARDLKMSQEQKDQLAKNQKQNQDRNEKYNQELEELGQRQTVENRQRLQLWYELGRVDVLAVKCPYSQKQISKAMLFSDEVEIEHILPFSRTLDDSLANKTLSLRSANRIKGNRSPYEAFGHTPQWEAIQAYAHTHFPTQKKWRFEEDAMQKFEKEGDFLARQLNDTAYLARVSREYLTAILPQNQIWTIPGRMTALQRAKWGLNEILGKELEDGSFQKSRDDHRHHALDALVVALTDRSMMQKISTLAAQNWEMGLKTFKGFAEPWVGFGDAVRAKVEKIVVSHKQDHGIGGALHNDTAYGIRGEFKSNGPNQVVHRVPVNSLNAKIVLEKMPDSLLKSELLDVVNGLTGKELQMALNNFTERTQVRHVRIVENLTVIPLMNRQGKIYKAVKGDGNYCYDVWATDSDKWDGEVVSTFDANRKGFDPKRLKSRTGKGLVMRIRNGDTMCIEEDGVRHFYRVAMISEGIISMCGLNESGNLRERERDPNDSFKYLRKSLNPLKAIKGRIVRIDEAGFVYDPGFKLA